MCSCHVMSCWALATNATAQHKLRMRNTARACQSRGPPAQRSRGRGGGSEPDRLKMLSSTGSVQHQRFHICMYINMYIFMHIYIYIYLWFLCIFYILFVVFLCAYALGKPPPLSISLKGAHLLMCPKPVRYEHTRQIMIELIH